MENSPIETNSFRHFFLVRGVKTYIIEPDNFDQSNFKVVQDDISRDTYFGNEESQLEFSNNYGEPCVAFMNNDGVLVSHLQSGLNIIIEENKNYGNEADIKYGLEKNGVSFTTGNVDFNKDFETDNETYVKCRVIQNTNQFLIKKREDIIVDLLATKDLDDNDITAIPIQRMFLKAKPTYGTSEWLNGESRYFIPIVGIWQFSPFQVVKQYGIENTLSFLSTVVESGTAPDFDSFSLIQAKDDLSNVKIKIELEFNSESFPLNNLMVKSGTVIGGTSNLQIFDIQDTAGYYNNTIEIELPNLVKAAERIEIFFYGTLGGYVNFYKANVTMSATSTAISSVINATRFIDLIKQNYKAIGSLPVNAPKYDVGGEFYDNFCFTKNLIKQDLTKPFYCKLKDVKEQLLEQCAFAQINDNEIYIGQYEDFYTNNDLGGFLEAPDYEANLTKNPKYLVNKFVFGYEKYEQDRAGKNTSDAIHTNSEWFPQAKNSINTKDFKLPFPRDCFLHEYMREDEFSINNNNSESDTTAIVDVTLLPPNSRNKFTRLLTWQANGITNTVKFLSDNTFSWTQLGFNVGDTIIEFGIPKVVLEMTPTILTCSYVGGTANGVNFLTFDYPLTNVLYTNRTNEGLIFAENLKNSDNFGNLRYSIKRNMRHWFSVLATYGKFIFDKKIKNTYFKANGECTTQFLGETEPIKENEDILISDITDKKILSQDIYKTKVRCSFEQAVQLLEDIQDVRGFIRVQNPSGGIIKGYIKEADNLWANEELVLELEVKNESDFLEVTFSDGILYINEVGYDEKTATIKNYNIFNDFIQFFDENNINLCNRTKFDKVSVNGITYDSIDNLVNAIEAL